MVGLRRHRVRKGNLASNFLFPSDTFQPLLRHPRAFPNQRGYNMLCPGLLRPLGCAWKSSGGKPRRHVQKTSADSFQWGGAATAPWTPPKWQSLSLYLWSLILLFLVFGTYRWVNQEFCQTQMTQIFLAHIAADKVQVHVTKEAWTRVSYSAISSLEKLDCPKTHFFKGCSDLKKTNKK